MKKPTQFSQLIGPAAKVGKILETIARRMKSGEEDAQGFLLFGPPGSGKSSLARIFALLLAEEPLEITEVSGVNVNVQLVREWQDKIGMSSLFGDWKVRWIEEVDRVPRDAQDLLLHYLDKMPPKTCLVATSNLETSSLQERFQTRLRAFKVPGPSIDELTRFLIREHDVSQTVAKNIANFAGGNVRQAVLDAQNARDGQLALVA